MKRITGLSVLIAARKLITPRRRWTRGAWARGKSGRSLSDLHSPRAVCWCASGALSYVSGGSGEARDVARNALIKGMHGSSILSFNDTSTHKQVLAAFDRAIAILSKRKRLITAGKSQ